MPHTADRMGLIHKPGTGPNNRFDFKNKGNNRANEFKKEDAAGVGLSQNKTLPKMLNQAMSIKMLKN